MNSKIGVIGLWHLGCVISVSWSKLGHKVYGFDYDPVRINNLNIGEPPIYEPGLKENIIKGIESKTLHFSDNISDLKDCDHIFLSYDTPVNDDDSCDTTILEKSVSDVGRVMKDNAVLIISSQSPVGFCNELRNKLKSNNPTLEIAYSPENLRLGEAIECYLNPGRIILGTAVKETELKCVSLFNEITNNVLTMNLESAEMVKHGINSFLAMSIVFANNISDICEEKGGKIEDVVKGLKSDIRIGQKAYLSPGIGFSGGTLGRDLKVLDSINNESQGFAKLFGFIHYSNNERKHSIIMKVKKILNGIEGKKIGVLGLTYKPGTSTLRRSLPLEVVDLLLDKNAEVSVYDPKAEYSELKQEIKFKITKSIEEVSKNSDILLLLTDWPEFKTYDWESILINLNQKIFYDTKNLLDEEKMGKIGFQYYSIGSAQ